MPPKPQRYEPFNPFIQEYMCKRLASLTEEEYKMLSTNERYSIFKVGKIRKFVKSKSIFHILSILTKIGINWGIYIIDKNFDLQRFNEIYEDKSCVHKLPAIKDALNEQKSFITDSQQFSEIMTLMTNSTHSNIANWDRRFIDFSEKISTKVKDTFDNFSLLTEEVDYKKASDGSKLLLNLFGNMTNTSLIVKQKGITLTQFSILCNLRTSKKRFVPIEDINDIIGFNSKKLMKILVDKQLVTELNKTFNISTNGILLTGRIFSEILDNVEVK